MCLSVALVSDVPSNKILNIHLLSSGDQHITVSGLKLTTRNSTV